MLIQWSYSSLKEYLNCPRQYEETRIKKNFKKQVTQQMLYGTEVHKALEDYISEGKELLKNYQRFKPVLDTLLEIPGKRYPEHRMAVTEKKEPCTFGAKDYWVRGIADLLVVDKDTAYIVDYKTGSNRYPDTDQLKLMALLTFANFENITHVKAGLLFVMHDSFITEDYKLEKADKLWEPFEHKITRLKLSFENNSWPPNPTPLCGWCSVRTCEFHKER